ncbi:MAG: AI-2E family transporter [Saprospiraceae bacterium]|nr:AI-2E family transporter [Saprospiraceae bacterium]
MNLSFQKAFYVIATFIGLFAILILAKAVLIPIAFAFLIAFILFPVVRKFESWGTNEIVSASLSILGLALIIGGGVFLFSNQVILLSEDLNHFQVKILDVFADATLLINKNIGFLPHLEKGELLDKIKNWLSGSASSLLSQTFNSTASFVFGLLMSVIYTFLILIYRNGLVRALTSFYPPEHRERAFRLFKSVQQVGQKYLFGMMVVLVILGFVNSIGLWIIGIDNPFLFGFLAAVLALIPYAGTLLGAAIPILYSFLTFDSIWMPISIFFFFWFVQVIESNFLTPKIVGGNLKLNALTSILSIIIGASVWGIAGMILFLPLVAMFKAVCEEYIELKPFALLIGEKNYNTKDGNDKFTGKLFKKINTLFSKFRISLKKEQTGE